MIDSGAGKESYHSRLHVWARNRPRSTRKRAERLWHRTDRAALLILRHAEKLRCCGWIRLSGPICLIRQQPHFMHRLSRARIFLFVDTAQRAPPCSGWGYIPARGTSPRIHTRGAAPPQPPPHSAARPRRTLPAAAARSPRPLPSSALACPPRPSLPFPQREAAPPPRRSPRPPAAAWAAGSAPGGAEERAGGRTPLPARAAPHRSGTREGRAGRGGAAEGWGGRRGARGPGSHWARAGRVSPATGPAPRGRAASPVPPFPSLPSPVWGSPSPRPAPPRHGRGGRPLPSAPLSRPRLGVRGWERGGEAPARPGSPPPSPPHSTQQWSSETRRRWFSSSLPLLLPLLRRGLQESTLRSQAARRGERGPRGPRPWARTRSCWRPPARGMWLWWRNSCLGGKEGSWAVDPELFPCPACWGRGTIPRQALGLSPLFLTITIAPLILIPIPVSLIVRINGSL